MVALACVTEQREREEEGVGGGGGWRGGLRGWCGTDPTTDQDTVAAIARDCLAHCKKKKKKKELLTEA